MRFYVIVCKRVYQQVYSSFFRLYMISIHIECSKRVQKKGVVKQIISITKNKALYQIEVGMTTFADIYYRIMPCPMQIIGIACITQQQSKSCSILAIRAFINRLANRLTDRQTNEQGDLQSRFNLTNDHTGYMPLFPYNT